MSNSHTFRLLAASCVLSLLPLSPALYAQKGGKPPKVAWSPSRVENSHVVGGVVTVQATADADALAVTLRPTPSLAGFITVPAGPIDLLANTPTSIDLQVLMTPDEAGQTIGGTVHVLLNGKNLAQPLVVSLQQTVTEEEGEEEEEGESGSESEEEEDGEGKPAFISWSDGSAEILALTPDLVPGGIGQISFIPSLTLTNIILWPTPSLSRCLDVVISPSNAEQVGVFELGPNGEIALVAAGTPVVLDLTMPVPPDQLTGGCGGTLHVRNAGKPRRTWSRPLNVRLGPEDEDDELSENQVAPAAAVGAASFEVRPIAPGQIVSVFGVGLGPSKNALFELDQNGDVGETAGGTMVFFDGVPARILSVRNDQVNVIVPYGLEGTDVELLVVHGGHQSTPFPIPLRRAAPELFTLTGAGQGQVVAFNQNGTLNRSTNAARVPSTVVLFGTGAGQTIPPLAEGEIATTALPLKATVRVFVGGVEATVLYAGTSPGQVGSLTQFNIELGAGTPPGQQPVQVIVDGISSTQKATLAVR